MAHSATMRAAVGAEIEHEEIQGQPPVAACGSDAARLAVIVESYFDFAWRALRRLGVPGPSVDDAAQQLFMVVAQRLRSIEPDRERAFVFGIAVRIAASFRRKQRRERDTCPLEADGASTAVASLPSPEELLELKRARALLDYILDQMPLELRAAFILAEGEGMTRREIGELCGIPEGTAGSRLRRAREFFDVQVAEIHRRNGECQ